MVPFTVQESLLRKKWVGQNPDSGLDREIAKIVSGFRDLGSVGGRTWMALARLLKQKVLW